MSLTGYDRRGAWQVQVSARKLDYTVALGPTPAASVRTLTAINGRHRLPPAWAQGPMLVRAAAVPALPGQPAPETRATARGRLACLMGLWNNVLDYNGIDKYVLPSYQKLHPTARPVERLLTVGTPAQPTKFALCSMNFGFTRDMIPAAYQMPMDREIIPGYPLWRFEDIWGGYVIEALVHKRGGQDVVGIGEPTVAHLKEGNLVRETHGEHFGHLMSPFFYAFIDAGYFLSCFLRHCVKLINLPGNLLLVFFHRTYASLGSDGGAHVRLAEPDFVGDDLAL